MKNKNLIPSTFNCGGQPMEVRLVDKCDSDDAGNACWIGGFIEIGNKISYNIPQSEGSKINTFFHELVHTILFNMGEKELNNNERFVCSFAGFLTEAMTTADYPEDVFNKMLLDLKTNPVSKIPVE